MPRAVPSSSQRERRSSQFTAPGQAVPSPTAVSLHTRLAGLIVQFPPRNELEKPPGVNLHVCYDHPCVILSPVAVDGVVTVLPMTSFGNRPLQVRYPKRRHAAKRAHYLPVAPAPAHPDAAAARLPLLRLADPARMAMRKDSYVNTERPYPGIPLAVLRPFHGRHGPAMTLDAVSYQLLLERAGFAPPPPPLPLPLPLAPPSTELLEVAVRPAAPPPPPRQNPSPVPLLDHGDCSIDVDHLRQSRPLHHPPPSYGTVPGSWPPHRAPMRSTTPGARGEAPLGSYSGGAAGPRPPAGFVAGVVIKGFLWASVLFLVGYGGYLGVVKTVEGVQLFGAWVRNCVGAWGDAARGAFRGVHGSIAGAGDGVRGV